MDSLRVEPKIKRPLIGIFRLAKHLVSLAIFLLTTQGFASTIHYHGRILKPNGTPLQEASVEFVVKIRSPGNEACLLYQETLTASVVNGLFSLPIGSGHRDDTNPWTFERALSNRAPFSVNASDCTMASAYNPQPSHGRMMTVTFQDPTMSQPELLPVQAINYAPMAIESQFVAGYGSGSLLKIEGVDNRTTLSILQLNELVNLTNGNFVRSTASAGAAIPSYSGNATGAVAGSLWFDSSTNQLKFFDGTNPVVVGSSSGGSGGIGSLNGLTVSTQTFAVGTGASLAWSSVGTTHTLSIPMAVGASVPAGLLSNADYLSFTAKLGPALNAGQIFVGSTTNIATAVTPTGDVSLASNGATSLVAIRGEAVASGTPLDGQVFRWNTSTKWTPAYLSMADVRSTMTPTNTIFPNTTCNPGQTLNWTSLTDTFTCQAITIDSAHVNYGSGITAGYVFSGPASGIGAPTFRALQASDLPAGTNTQWISSGANIYYSSGNVGIGTATPTGKLHVVGGTAAANTDGASIIVGAQSAGSGGNNNGGHIILNPGSKTGTGQGGSLLIGSASAPPWVPANSIYTYGGLYLGADAVLFNGTNLSWGDSSSSINGANSGGVGNLTFYASGTHRMHINTVGAIGIGTLTPGSDFTLYRSGATAFYEARSSSMATGYLSKTDSGLNTYNGFFSGGAASGSRQKFIGNLNGSLVLGRANDAWASNIAQLTITNSGDVGIGTDTPGALLDLYGVTTANSALIVPRSTTSTRPLVPVNGMIRYNTDLFKMEIYGSGAWASVATGTSGSATPAGSTGQIQFNTAGALNANPAFIWDNTNSYLGVGAATPQAELHVADSGTATEFLLTNNTGSTINDGLRMRMINSNSSIINQENGSLTLGANNSTNQLVLSSSGNVGIGTTNPFGKLHVVGNVHIDGDLISYNTPSMTKKMGDATSNNQWFRFAHVRFDQQYQYYTSYFTLTSRWNGLTRVLLNARQNDPMSSSPNVSILVDSINGNILRSNIVARITQDDANFKSIDLYMRTPVAFDSIAIQPNATVNWTNEINYEPGAFVAALPAGTSVTPIQGPSFWSSLNGTDISYNGGSIGVGTDTPGYKLDVQGGDINASGNVRAAGVVLTSDIRFKKDIEVLDSALAKILRLRGVRYKWRTEEFPNRHFNSREQVGVIAQEVEAEFPELVDTAADGYKAVNYPALVSPLIESTKELYENDQKHDAEIDELKRENAELKARLERIEQLLSEKK